MVERAVLPPWRARVSRCGGCLDGGRGDGSGHAQDADGSTYWGCPRWDVVWQWDQWELALRDAGPGGRRSVWRCRRPWRG